MNQPETLFSLALRGLAAAGLGVPLALLGGCSGDARPDNYGRGYYDRPPEQVERDDRSRTDVPEERYEAAPAEVNTEYDRDLGPYGRWVQTREYGRCWVPNDRPSGWRPYSVGHWADTDQGWTWVAEGPEADWGVVTYHYGRWYEDQGNGWVWVPGTTWAPAWVAWRDGGGYAGWAPLPPQCGIGVNISLGLVDRYCPPERFVYVDERYLGEPRIYDHYERNDVTIINRTTNITNIRYENNRIINRGVAVENVERRSGHSVQRVQVADATNISDARRLRAEGKPVRYGSTLIQHADQSNNSRYEHQMSHNRAVDRVNDQKNAQGLAHDHAAERGDAERKAASDAHQRAVERGNAEKLNTGVAHDHAIDRGDAEKKAESDAHQRAVDRANAEKLKTGEAHDHAVNRGDAEKKAESDAHQRAVDRANAEKLKAGEAHEKPAAHADAPRDEKAAAHERAVQRNEGKKPEEKPAQP